MPRQCSAMVLFAHNVEKNRGAADENGEVDGTCKQTLKGRRPLEKIQNQVCVLRTKVRPAVLNVLEIIERNRDLITRSGSHHIVFNIERWEWLHSYGTRSHLVFFPQNDL